MPELSGSEPPKISDEAIEIAGRHLQLAAKAHGAFSTAHTMREWARGALTAAYPLLRQQWETEFLESLKKHGGDQWLEGYEAGCSMSHSLGCDAVEAQRDYLVAEVARLRQIANEVPRAT
jgi:hypothetical protein